MNLKFDHNNDTVYIAYYRPYRYSDMILHTLFLEYQLARANGYDMSTNLQGLTLMTIGGKFTYQRKLLCSTLSGLPVLEVEVSATSQLGKKLKQREAIVVTSRVHPGETNASFVFETILEMILKTNVPEVQELRENYVFKLVSCLNPDGVVIGNYRSNFAGVDLNRQWVAPQQTLHPTIYHTKKMLNKIKQERGILIFCDLHGHSRKKNSFMYGCNKAADGGFNSWTKVRLFPRLLAKLNPIFDINSCKFKVERSKYGTGRVVVWKTFEVTNSFTLENSFHGYDYGTEFREFQPDDLNKLGRDIVMTFWQYNRILVAIDNELKITRGWLKPKRLLEITGTSAKEMIKKNLEYIQNGKRNN